ncbi:MAG: tetratricopeptide repeat protein [Desulfobacteraceae bacterium]|nr:tetratricopeptide repeat protein [Desulfobacteraceae bacterium]
MPFSIFIMRLPDGINSSSSCRLFFLVSLLLFLAYSNSFYSSWQFDDQPNILVNKPIQLEKISLANLLQTAFAKPGSGEFYRPIACLSLALNWYFGQKDVFGYHIINFLVHCCAAWLLFLTIKTLFLTPRLKGCYTPGQIEFIAVMAVLFWALNPIHTQAVTYIVQRMASMAAMFSLLAIFCYLKARLNGSAKGRMVLLVCAVISYLLAILSKENAVTIVLSVPLLELLFFRHDLSRSFVQKTVGGVILGGLICVLVGFALRPELFDFIINYYDNRPFTLVERVLTEQKIVLFYISQLFFPAPGRLSIDHDIILSTSLFNPWTTGAAVLVHILLLLLAVRMGKKQPLFSLAVLFFYLNHLVESTIIPLELVFEHRNYLPSLFLFLPLAQALNWIMIQVQENKFIILFIGVLLGCLLATEGYATYERNKAWKTEESLWLDALVKAPNSSRPLATLAVKLAWGPNPNGAKYRKALELTKRTLSMRMSRRRLDAAQFSNMASLYNKLGEYKEANFYYEKALTLAPEDAGIRYNFCKNLVVTGNFFQAKVELLKILDKGFVHADYFDMLGFIDLWTGQPKKALPAIQQAMKYAPGHPNILLTLGKCFSILGYHDKSNWYLSQARKNGRDDAIVSLCIIENHLRAGKIELAQNELKRSLKNFSLIYFFRPLRAPADERYRRVPLDNKILIDYIQSQLRQNLDQLLLTKGKKND